MTMPAIQYLLGPNGLMFSMEDKQSNVHIFWGGHPYYNFHRNNAFQKKLGIALLAQLGVMQKTICEFFQVNRHTIGNLLEIYQREGIEGLRLYRPGPAGIEYELKQFVIRRYIELEGRRGYQNTILEGIRQKVEAGEYKRGIKRSKLQKILREYRDGREQQRRSKLEGREAKQKGQGQRKGRKRGNSHGGGGEDGVRELDFTGRIDRGKEICVESGGAATVIVFLQRFGMQQWVKEGE